MHSHAGLVGGDLLLLFFASLAGSAHCVGMCGPYVALCAARISPSGSTAGLRAKLSLLFNAGRVAAYVAVGVLVGAFGQVVLAASDRAGLRGAVSLTAGAAAILFGLALLGGIGDPATVLRRSGLDLLIRGGALRAFRAPPYISAVLLGALQGAFPCALVYGAASRAAVAGSASSGAATMLVFGLGTVPAVFALSSLSPDILTRLKVWRWAGVFVGTVGLLLVLRGLAELGAIRHTELW